MAGRAPTSTKQATALLEQYARIDAEIADIEAARQATIVAANAVADAKAADLIARRTALAERIEPWWAANGAALTQGKRKSIELGGCMVGTRAGRASLDLAGPEEDVVAVLSGLRWAKPLLRTRVSLERTAALRSLDGKHGAVLAELGVSRRDGAESFYIERVQQAGTLGGTEA